MVYHGIQRLSLFWKSPSSISSIDEDFQITTSVYSLDLEEHKREVSTYKEEFRPKYSLLVKRSMVSICKYMYGVITREGKTKSIQKVLLNEDSV